MRIEPGERGTVVAQQSLSEALRLPLCTFKRVDVVVQLDAADALADDQALAPEGNPVELWQPINERKRG